MSRPALMAAHPTRSQPLWLMGSRRLECDMFGARSSAQGCELSVVRCSQAAPGTFLCSPCNSGVTVELVLAGGGRLLLCMGSLNFKVIKTGLAANRIRQKPGESPG